MATKAEVASARAELSERVFNATLRFDIAERHTRELMEKETKRAIADLRGDLRTADAADNEGLLKVINKLEVQILAKQSDIDRRFEQMNADHANLELRVIRYVQSGFLGLLATSITFGLAAARLFM
jgi:hypothetical protein